MPKKKTPKRKRATGRKKARPKSLRDLANAVFAQHDPVEVGSDLLNADSESVKLRALESLAGWAYETPTPVSNRLVRPAGIRLVWDIPSRPPQPLPGE
jgi:hypothetical protein